MAPRFATSALLISLFENEDDDNDDRDPDEQDLIPTGLRSDLASEAASLKYLNAPAIAAAVSVLSPSFHPFLFRRQGSVQLAWRRLRGVPSEPRL